jgi:cell division protein FtsI/penicillin-binding protein 2
MAVGLGVGARRDSAAESLAPVSAGAPPVRDAAAGAAMPEAPASLAGRLPAGREALALPVTEPAEAETGPLPGRLYEYVALPPDAAAGITGPLRVEYSLDAGLTREVWDSLQGGRVGLGHVILMDPSSGRVLAYASTDPARFDPARLYPAASLVKVITASAALDADPEVAKVPCRFTGSPYRLTPSRIDPPRRGREISLSHALATSNNQCFAQLAVHSVGHEALRDAIGRFGWFSVPAPAHAAGVAAPVEDRYDVGKLGCGLDGCRITPLHAVQLAGVLARGELVSPHWIDRVVDAGGRELEIAAPASPRHVIAPERAEELRDMLVETTTGGTARRAFRQRNGRPVLGPIHVAGKTGSLSGDDPKGKYEWFMGVAPAEAPRVAIAVLVVQQGSWRRTASQVASDVLRRVFCEGGRCELANAGRYLPVSAPGDAPSPAAVAAKPPDSAAPETARP